ncbi:MarR family winged helix-turn-helix transcriptional regulator [Cellulophaga sp. BC115SP]|uniref:MarR family winged helix-turn-helix transcriptional regulator n=1 Tax=Cellulophaga sp. BC115SP TaxID=2683263 RepID=UPI001411CBFD|nr:MarR family transcriptional regulator [Cellulophaga sp. BC115SP]NBB31478.1 MarR family transcriptional regulator [Cellulophaga sp. BC115SP]
MSIEQDIQQKAFKSPYTKAVVNIMFTNNWLCTLQSDLLKRYDVTLQQYNVLRILRGQHPNPITVCGIIERMLDKMSNASRLVDKLILKDLVIRKECPHDRRQVDVIITDKGLDLLAELDNQQSEWETALHKLSPEEALTLSHLLDKLRGSAE